MGFRVQAYGPDVTSRLGGSRGFGVRRAPEKGENQQARPASPRRRRRNPAARTNAGSVGRPSPRSIDRPASGTPRYSATNTSEISAQATIRRSIDAAPRFSYFGFGPGSFADPPRILKGGTRMAAACGRPGPREGGDDAVPEDPVPPLLRWIQADPPGPLRATRVRLHVLDRGHRSAASRILAGGGASIVPVEPGPGARILFERIL